MSTIPPGILTKSILYVSKDTPIGELGRRAVIKTKLIFSTNNNIKLKPFPQSDFILCDLNYISDIFINLILIDIIILYMNKCNPKM